MTKRWTSSASPTRLVPVLDAIAFGYGERAFDQSREFKRISEGSVAQNMPESARVCRRCKPYLQISEPSLASIRTLEPLAFAKIADIDSGLLPDISWV
jgi:hypothetical protein